MSQGVSTKTVSELEHYYVKSFKDKKGYINDIKKISNNISVSDGIAIINGIVEAISVYLNIKSGL